MTAKYILAVIIGAITVISLVVVYGTIIAFIIELFKDKEIGFGLFVTGLTLLSMCYIASNFL